MPSSYLDKTGCQWRALPHDFPKWHTVDSYYRRWRLAGVWPRIHQRLREQVRITLGREPTPSAAVRTSRTTTRPSDGLNAKASPADRSRVRVEIGAPRWSVPMMGPSEGRLHKASALAASATARTPNEAAIRVPVMRSACRIRVVASTLATTWGGCISPQRGLHIPQKGAVGSFRRWDGRTVGNLRRSPSEKDVGHDAVSG